MTVNNNQMVHKTRKDAIAPCGNCYGTEEIVEWDFSKTTGKPEIRILCECGKLKEVRRKV